MLLAAAAAAPSSAAAARPVLSQPYDLLSLKNGRFLVTDLPGNAVYELDPVRKTGRLVVRIDQARVRRVMRARVSRIGRPGLGPEGSMREGRLRIRGTARCSDDLTH